MRDPELEAYVVALEEHWSRRRGTPHTLSPRDFALARAWFESGIPLGAVLDGVGRALEQDPAASSLAFCRRFVEAAAARLPPRPLAADGAAPGAVSGSGDELRQGVSALVRALERAGPTGAFDRAFRTLREIEDLLGVARRPNWVFLRDKLAEAESLVSRAALESLSADERRALEAEADAAARRQRGRVDASALALAARRYLLRRARERLGLPAPLALD